MMASRHYFAFLHDYDFRPSQNASPVQSLAACKLLRPSLSGLMLMTVLLLAGCGFGKDHYWPEKNGSDHGTQGGSGAQPAPAQPGKPGDPATPPSADVTPGPAPAPKVIGCVPGGSSRASEIVDSHFQLHGASPTGGVGDFLLSNDQAAFVITGTGPQKTYYHYGGILVDAVALDACEQKVDETFFEMPLMMARLRAAKQALSTFRAFHADQVEVLNDGSDGKAAIVRATGSDDIYWLLELELMARAVDAGLSKSRSQPFNLGIEVDYILEPHSPTLKVEYRLKNLSSDFNPLSMAFVLLSPGGGPSLNTFSTFDLKAQGLDLQYGLPWVSASNAGTEGKQGTWIYGANSDVLTTTQIAGVDALFDARQFGNTYFGQLLAPNGEPKDTLQRDFYVTVDAGDELSALHRYLATTPKSLNTITTPVQGRVLDDAEGTPLAGAKIEFQTLKQTFLKAWTYETFITTYSDAEGKFGGDIPFLTYLPSEQPYRVVVSLDGRAPAEPVVLQAGQPNKLTVRLNGEGEVSYRIVDQDGKPSPARLSVYKTNEEAPKNTADNDALKRLYSATGNGTFRLPPGEYQVGISRGFEYAIVEQPLTVKAGVTTSLTATLNHVIDTEGFLSFDAHVHSSPSPDSNVSPADRIRTAAATGLEVVVSTDHEIITDLKPAVTAAGANEFVATVIGQEVTAPIPNHTIAYPLPHTPEPGRQFVAWHGLDLAGIFAEEARYGAQIRTLAHPRSDYLNLIQWDRLAGAPGMTDPTRLGFSADAQLWSWDFEAMELLNGPSPVFGADPHGAGLFDDWMSFLNHGHRITATGASDVHDLEVPGTPRNYFAASSDRPRDFRQPELVDAVREGRVLVSTGAFARIRLDGSAGMGDTVTDTDGTVNLTLEVQALPQIDVTDIRVYVNCDEVARIPATAPAGGTVKLQGGWNLPVPAGQDAHVVVMGFGQQRYPRELPQFDAAGVPRFVTNPVFVDGDGDGRFTAPGGKTCQH